MIIWNYYGYTLFNIIFILILFIYKSKHEKCYCYVNGTNSHHHDHHGDYHNVKRLIHCSLIQLSSNYSEEILCQRIDQFICIGPYLSNDSNINLLINPWAFSNLFNNNNNNIINTLQLDLNINTQQINALTLAGMNSLRNLLARTSLTNWDSCSFIGLINLHEITLNCKSILPEYLTFGSFITVIRFVDCIGVPLQFYCIQCIQDSNVYVIRIRPGPPLRQYLIKFTRLSSLSSSSSSVSSISSVNNKMNERNEDLSSNHHLPLDSCVYGVCSDEMLCRNNLPLKQAQTGIGQPEKPIIEVVSNNELFISNTTSMELYYSVQLSTIQPILKTTSSMIQSMNTTSIYDIVILTKYGHSKSDNRQRIWIVSAIIILIILFIITIGILIIINYQRKSKHRLKSRSNKSVHNHNNGIHNKPNGRTTQHDSLIISEDGNRIELPDIVSCK
ncbi:unnamed protein product [Schistosoma spindalis]|nr:unnamed protein product [Schistosoma spindale]